MMEIFMDASILPFPSTPGDWFNCFHPDSGEMVYIEHPVIIAIMQHRGHKVVENPSIPEGMEGTDGVRWMINMSETYSEHGNAVGTSIVRYLTNSAPPRHHGTCFEFYLPEFPSLMLCGFFGGKTFVFFDKRK
jgi:hypothetical protein